MPVIRRLCRNLIGVPVLTALWCAVAGPVAAAGLPQDPAPVSPTPTSIALSGSVTDGRAERMAGGVITAPPAMPAVAGASIEVNGALVGRTDSSGGFAFDYPDPSGAAVTVTVAAPGFGTYRLTGVTPAHTGDSLTVQLTGRDQSAGDQSGPVPAPPRRAAAVATPMAAGNCGGYSSNTTAPATIQVLEYSQHDSTGAPVAGTATGVFSVPFQTYVDDVLPNEWIPSWQPAALEAGAMAAKTYAWNWVNNWRGQSYDGTCYSVDDSTNDQRFIPGRSNPATDTAVAATWNSVMTRAGSIFPAYYRDTLTGNPGEACGAGASGSTLSQWGSQNCAAAGDSWQSILGVYYSGISISSGSSATLGAVSMNGSGDHVAFVDTNGNVANDWVQGSAWQGPAPTNGQARPDSPVVLDPKSDHVFFADTNGNLANDWLDSNGHWQGPAPIGGQARAGSPIATDANGNIVTFIDTNGNVVNDWLDGNGTWHGPDRTGGTARADSGLAIDANGDHIYFIDTNGNLSNDWVANGAWQGPSGTSGQARPGSPIATDANGNLVTFIDTNSNVVNDWLDGNGTWHGPNRTGGTARADSGLAIDANGDHIYFIDTNGNVSNDWVQGNAWQGPSGTSGQARPGSAIATDANGNLVTFIDTNSNVVNDWLDGNGTWHGPDRTGGTSR